MFKPHIFLLLFFFALSATYGQEVATDSLRVDTVEVKKKRKKRKRDKTTEIGGPIDPLRPSKAAFYSAVIPGLGQAYNKRYWKVPLALGAVGAGIYFIDYNNNRYDSFRDAFKRRRAGFTDDEYYDIDGTGIVPGSPDFSDEALQDAQVSAQRDRDLSILLTVVLYVLNIIDANVDAHLQQFNVDENLSLNMQPYLRWEDIQGQANYGLSLQIQF